ncbi:hypothetical protein STSP2_00768 [Anaerohalosphaera lusitana]|uniref:Uncharacterized protein n=1 Tax=Anaerohalosphaera lusitana TaxID=1936003 RepID=A0A1U9NJ59_9BACT|nr:hypothetical protein [Anaerohalosphaera lusitana]AQT67620.1 hypothetical protein STSP2_00768 [Anaerohalosphaera lusitana]
MAIQAPYSSYRKKNLVIWAVVLLAAAAWFAYDGYINEDFIQEHTSEEGVADSDLKLNRMAPFVLVPGAALLGIGYWLFGKKKVTADEEGITAEGRSIKYDQIEAVNKTHFDNKGKFTVIYKDANGKQDELVLSRYKYDNISAVLDKIVEKIS